MKKYKNLLIWIGVVIFYFFFAQMLIPAIIYALNIDHNLTISILLLLTDFTAMALLVWLYIKEFKEASDDFNKSFKERMTSTIRVWLFGLVLMIIFNSIIGSLTGDIASNESANRVILDKYTVYALPAMIIFCPICEEIIFRLSLKRIFKNNTLFIIISGLLFGFAHVIGTSGYELLYFIPYGILGSCFAYMYVKNKNILCSISAHVLHNLICILIILFL